MSEALYRKYRPQVFEDVVGQDHIERTLKNAIEQDKVSHAYLFCGPRGTGKTTTARLLAKALLCENGPTSTPDGTCEQCQAVANGTHPDVYELDAASRTGVENVRDEIIGRVNYAPTSGSKKVYIIDEVHMLSTAAFNALLKTLEEPPSHVVFVLCTTDPQKVPETIHSRCQRFDFHRISNDEIVARLGAVCVAEDVEFEGDALDLIAHRAQGGMRNALTSLEQLIAFGEGKVTVKGAEDLLGSLDSSDMAEIIDAIGKRDAAACFTWTATYMETGADLAQFVRDMAQHVRNMYVMSLAGADAAIDITDAERREIVRELEMFGSDRLANMLGVLGDVVSDMRSSTNPRLLFEIALTRLVRPDAELTLASLAERVEALEGGAAALPARSAVAVPAQAPVAVPVAAPAPAPVAAPAPAPAPAPVASQAPVAPAPAPAPAQAAPSKPLSGHEAARAAAAAAAARAQQARNHANVAAAPAPAPARTAPKPAPSRPYAQPTPAVPAAASPAQAGGDLASVVSNPAALQRMWRSVVAAVKKEKPAYGVFLIAVKVVPEPGNTGVRIEFAPGNEFAFSRAQKPEFQEMLKRIFVQVAGVDVPFTCVQAAAAAPAPAPVAQPARPAAAPVVPPRPAPAPAPVAAPVPPVDDVPLDAYEGVVPAEAPAYDAPAAAPMPAAASMPATADGVAPETADDFSKMLSETMGSSIVFEQIDE